MRVPAPNAFTVLERVPPDDPRIITHSLVIQNVGAPGLVAIEVNRASERLFPKTVFGSQPTRLNRFCSRGGLAALYRGAPEQSLELPVVSY
jgi:hypothetical protein